MKNLSPAEAAQIFKNFEEICAIPHGSGNMDAISRYCMEFAEKHGLKAICDDAKNVVIYKPGSKDYENAEPVILQGHLDMVCQKTEETVIDFAKDGLETYIDGDFIKAKGTTLGADNGIAVSMILAVLASEDLPHPPIEAVFTSDEEIGLLGAAAFDASLLKGRKLLNLDAEEANSLTVSCAGGSDFKMALPIKNWTLPGSKITLEIKGLKGGHSGVDIDKGRANANILMGRLLNYVMRNVEFNLIKIDGGNKGNAIPFCCKAELITMEPEVLVKLAEEYFEVIKKELSDREDNVTLCITAGEDGIYEVLDDISRDVLLYILLMTPNGVTDMSMEIDGLVETSLNLGILKSEQDEIIMHYALRSNKKTALDFLEDKLNSFAAYHGCETEITGRYEPWEFRENSPLQKLYIDAYSEKFGGKPQVVALHAGLETAVFAAKIDGLDCIAIGPDMFDVHTVNERLSISSTKEIFELLCDVLEKCK